MGDESSFRTLLELYGPGMLRLARTFVRTRAAAEEVVQDTWIAVLRGIDRFEGRSSLKTWLYRILVNTAKTRAVRDARSVPFSAPDSASQPGMWAAPPHEWPEERLEAKEIRALIDATIAELPPQQRHVITLRDIEGWTSEETCNALELSETNQRVLLHRARSRVRRALERHLDTELSEPE